MEDSRDCEFGACTEIAEAILQGAIAGGLRYWARRESRAMFGGLMRDAEDHSAAATALVNSWTARQPVKAAGRPAHQDRLIRPDNGPGA